MADDLKAANNQAIEGLKALVVLIEQGIPDGSLPTSDQHRPMVVGWGLLAALNRQAAAAVLLWSKGLAHEAAPNRRMVMECMACLQWLVRDREDAVDSLRKAHQHKHGQLKEAAEKANVVFDEQIAAAIQALEIPSNPANRYNSMKPLLERLGGGFHIRWVSETHSSHASLAVAFAFHEQTDDDMIRLLLEPKTIGDGPDGLTPLIVFLNLFMAAEAFNDLLDGAPWQETLARIGKTYDLRS